jgi:hypothetical protein
MSTIFEFWGKTLPSGQAPPVIKATDSTNAPWQTVLDTITLPENTIINISGKKRLARFEVVDGVSLFMGVGRQPAEINFEVLLLDKDSSGYIFPQRSINQILLDLMEPVTVTKVRNTLLNGLGIQQILIQSVNTTMVRGSTNIILKIKALENVFGYSNPPNTPTQPS